MRYIFLVLIMALSLQSFGQNILKIKVVDSETKEPLIGATAKLDNGTGQVSDNEGLITFTGLANGTIQLEFSYVGYQTRQQRFTLPLVGTSIPIVTLEADEEMEEVIITSDRSNRSIEDVPTRIEVLGAEELSEKAIMRSSNIAMLLRESTGIQMQQTSANSANQSIRIQGLDGRYTQVMKDGFPIFSGFAGGLSIMQIPPLDLQQVEVIKGSSSTLYGGGAIAGLVNLVTIKPEEERQLKLMLDQTSARGTTFNGFYAKEFGKLGITNYLSASYQKAYDVNEDDLSDIPEIKSITINPSLFYTFNESTKLRFTLNAALEERNGGDIQAIAGGNDPNHSFLEENRSQRYSSQLTLNKSFSPTKHLTFKNSVSFFDREIRQDSYQFQAEQLASFSELNYRMTTDQIQLVLGANVFTENFQEEPQTGVAARDYANETFGLFAQNNWKISKNVTLEKGLRVDHNTTYGTFVLPRVSALFQLTDQLSSRLGGGLGYKTPNIFTEQAEHLLFENLLPIDADLLKAERSYGANVDFNFKTFIGSEITLKINQLFFATQLNNSLVLRENNANEFFFENADGPVLSKGLETNVQLAYKDVKFFVNYALIDAKLKYDNINQQKPLTAKHNLGAVLVYEQEGKWRIGLESYYIGEQLRNDFSSTQDYWLVGLMALRKFDKFSLYVNFENFADTRQSRFEDLNLGSHSDPRFADIWAPTDGRIINAGVIVEL